MSISLSSPAVMDVIVNGKMRDGLLDRKLFTTLGEAKILIEEWRREYNQIRPHSALGYSPTGTLATGAGRTNITTGIVIGGRSQITQNHFVAAKMSY